MVFLEHFLAEQKFFFNQKQKVSKNLQFFRKIPFTFNFLSSLKFSNFLGSFSSVIKKVRFVFNFFFKLKKSSGKCLLNCIIKLRELLLIDKLIT